MGIHKPPSRPSVTASLFIGVSPGYDENAATITPARAAIGVRHLVSNEKGLSIHPGLAIYQRERNCPEGGEPVAAVLCERHAKEFITLAERLRRELKQVVAIVACYIGQQGTKTRGFKAILKGDLRVAGLAWQQAADDYATRHAPPIYVTCGIYSNADELVLQAEANQVRDLDAWEAAVKTICGSVSIRLNHPIEPIFYDATLTILTD